jgi:hypothetical protein
MSEFKRYQRKGLSEMRPFVSEEVIDIREISISPEDLKNGSPQAGDMIARNPKNHNDQWLVAKKYFDDNLELYSEDAKKEGNVIESKFLPHQQRVIDERTELIDKITKLHNFFKTEIFGNLDDEDQDLLDQQVQKMMNYADILFKRINKF